MADLAWGTLIEEANYQAILSESAGSFDLEFLIAWVEKNGDGYFIRDKTSPLDCLLLTMEDFHQLYMFNHGDEGSLFRSLTKR